MTDEKRARPPARNRLRRMRHRVPVRVRHHWKATAAVGAGLLALVMVFGEVRVRPYITSELVAAHEITDNIEGERDLFGPGPHTIELSFNETEYESMIRTFQEEGEKDFIRADIVIDGTLVTDVALRLKGNSTLLGLQADGSGMLELMPELLGMEDAAGLDMFDAFTAVSAEEYERLPWLISFDEFNAGRAYQGHTELSVRPGTTVSDTALNEALALELAAAAGQHTQDYAFTSLTVNGRAETPRLVLDLPDPPYADGFGDGVLYKALATGSFEYLGDDPTDYAESFDQVNSEGGNDLQPVMRFLEFVDESDDDRFGAELDTYLDVGAFAEYLALQNLLGNSDAMDGPGNNYYLWYDANSGRFTVLSWDLNMSFGLMEQMMEGFAYMDMDAMMEQMSSFEDMDLSDLPEGIDVPFWVRWWPGDGLPFDLEPPTGMGPPGGMGFPEGGFPDLMGGSLGSGLLKERFLKNEEFASMYEQAYDELREELVDSGVASEALDEIVDRAEAAGDRDAEAGAEILREYLASVAPTAKDNEPELPDFTGTGSGSE